MVTGKTGACIVAFGPAAGAALYRYIRLRQIGERSWIRPDPAADIAKLGLSPTCLPKTALLLGRGVVGNVSAASFGGTAD